MTLRRRPRPPRTAFRALAIGLVVAVVGLASCSDAHSKAQLDLANPGYDPSTVVILAPAGLASTLQDLGAAYTRLHPTISFVLVSDVVNGLEAARSRHFRPQVAANAGQSLHSDLTPDMWIDTSSSIRALLPPTIPVYGETQLVGYDGVALIVRPGNPDHVSGLSAFGAGSGFRTGLCRAHSTCGAITERALQDAGVSPKAIVVTADGAHLVTLLDRGQIQAALTLSTDAAGADVTQVPVHPAPHRYLTYQELRLDASPTAASFANWLLGPEAVSILTAHGLVQHVGLGAG